MKKVTTIFLSFVLAFAFSIVCFANGQEILENDTTYTNEFNISDEENEMLVDFYGEDFVSKLENGEISPDDIFEATGLEKSTLAAAFLFITSVFLLIPAIIVMIVFISKNKKLKEKIKRYELTYGVVYDSDVLKDMANIPPQNYNYNPQTFVPQYPEVNNQNISNSNFSDTLKDEQSKENDGGNI